MIHLSTLGSTDLRTDSGKDLESILAQPKRLGLLIYLAVEAPDRFVRRDTVLALFWPELDDAQARQALRSALYFLRQRLGEDVITSRGADELGTRTAALSSDVLELRRAADRDDAEAALSLYRGDFLAGFHIPDASVELDHWIANTRLDLRRRAGVLAWDLAERAERDGNTGRAVHWGFWAYAIDGDDEASLRRLMALLERCGDPGSAIRAYDDFALRLEADLGVSPSAETQSLVDRMRTARAPADNRVRSAEPPTRSAPEVPQIPAGPEALPLSSVKRVSRRRALALAGLAAVGLIVAALVLPRRGGDARTKSLAGPVVVAVFKNETGDTSLTIWGRYAGDWITQGLQEVGRVSVVPWATALRASRLVDSSSRSGNADPVAILRRQTGASTVITGSYYRVNDTLRFRAEVSDARTGRLIWSLPVIAVARDSVDVAIAELRDRLMGGVGLASDRRFAADLRFGRQPPRFESFVAYDNADGLFHRSKYDEAVIEYERASALDSNFLAPLLGAAVAYWNQAKYPKVDSLVQHLTARRAAMSEYQSLNVTWLQAKLRGDGRAALETHRRMNVVAPNSAETYNLALEAIFLNRPHEALRTLQEMDSSSVTVTEWAPYWIYLAHANHLVGNHKAELEAARELRRRFPDRRVGLVLAVCALAALDRIAAIDSALEADASAPPNTYWSSGAALVSAGEELIAHGYASDAPPYFTRAVDWLESQIRADPKNRYYREWLGSAFYQMGRWPDAQRIAYGLVADFPDRRSYRTMPALLAARRGDTASAASLLGEPRVADMGLHLAARARIAAIGGDPDRAASLFAEALDRGISEFQWDHADWRVDFARVLGDARIKRLLIEGVDRPDGKAR
jgi:DNA-binding SARP family transcriptional activator/TolB-like protein